MQRQSAASKFMGAAKGFNSSMGISQIEAEKPGVAAKGSRNGTTEADFGLCLLGANIKSDKPQSLGRRPARHAPLRAPAPRPSGPCTDSFLKSRLELTSERMLEQMKTIMPALRIWKKLQRLHQCAAPTWSIKPCSGGIDWLERLSGGDGVYRFHRWQATLIRSSGCMDGLEQDMSFGSRFET